MKILEDSRQQAGKHNIKHRAFEAAGDSLLRSKIPFGDYCLPPARAVDTKQNMLEIAQNIGGSRAEHERFIRELKLARDYGCELVVLIENEDGISDLADVQYWQNPRLAFSERAINGPQLFRAMTTIQERYGATFMFCRPTEAAEIIRDILSGGEADER